MPLIAIALPSTCCAGQQLFCRNQLNCMVPSLTPSGTIMSAAVRSDCGLLRKILLTGLFALHFLHVLVIPGLD